MKFKNVILAAVFVGFLPLQSQAAWIPVAGAAYVLGTLGCLGKASFSSVIRSDRGQQQYDERKRLAEERLAAFLEGYPEYQKGFIKAVGELKQKYLKTLQEVSGTLTSDEIFDIRFAWETIQEDIVLMKKDEKDLKSIIKKIEELEAKRDQTDDMVLKDKLLEKINELNDQSDDLNNRIGFTKDRHEFLKAVKKEWDKLKEEEKDEVTLALEDTGRPFSALYLEYAFEIGELMLRQLQNGNDEDKLKLFAERYFNIKFLYDIWSELKKNEQALVDLDKSKKQLENDIVKGYWGFQYKDCYSHVEDWSSDQVENAFDQIYYTFEGFSEIEGGLTLLDSFLSLLLGVVMLDEDYTRSEFVPLTPVTRDFYCERANELKMPLACLNFNEVKAFNDEIETINALNDHSVGEFITDVKNRLKDVGVKERKWIYQQIQEERQRNSLEVYKKAYEQGDISKDALDAVLKLTSLIVFPK